MHVPMHAGASAGKFGKMPGSHPGAQETAA